MIGWHHTLIEPDTPFAINRNSPQSVGLQLWWPFNPGGGLRLRDLNKGVTGTLTNGPVWRAANGSGFRSSLSFDGVDDYVAFGDVADFDVGTGNFTLTCWVLGGGINEYIIVKDTSTGADTGVFLYIPGTTNYVYWNGSADTVIGATSSTVWHHLAVSRTGTGASLATTYYDGVAVNTFTDSRTLSNAFNLMFGQSHDILAGVYFSGSLSDVRFYNRAVPAAVIRQMVDPITRWDLYKVRNRTSFHPDTAEVIRYRHLISVP